MIERKLRQSLERKLHCGIFAALIILSRVVHVDGDRKSGRVVNIS